MSDVDLIVIGAGMAGMNAAFATLVALSEREETGRGVLIECSMVEGALNAAAEQIVEYSAYRNIMQRMGNRCRIALNVFTTVTSLGLTRYTVPS